MSLREAAQQALDTLEDPWKVCPEGVADAIIALRTALALPGNDYERGFVDGMSHQAKSSVDRAVNAMARKPLTDEEIDAVCVPLGFAQLSPREVARAIERAHGIGGEA
jgi:hypothetical protein